MRRIDIAVFAFALGSLVLGTAPISVGQAPVAVSKPPDKVAATSSPFEPTDLRRQRIERRTVDAVIVNDPQSEGEHGFKGEAISEGYIAGRRWRASQNGWFSYELKAADKPLKLVCTYRGASARRPAFDIFVDGQKIASESIAYHPTQTFDVEYMLSEDLTRGKDRLTVRFQAQANSSTAGVLDVRIVWADLQE